MLHIIRHYESEYGTSAVGSVSVQTPRIRDGRFVRERARILSLYSFGRFIPYIWYLVQSHHYIAAASSTYSAMGSASAGEAQVES